MKISYILPLQKFKNYKKKKKKKNLFSISASITRNWPVHGQYSQYLNQYETLASWYWYTYRYQYGINYTAFNH